MKTPNKNDFTKYVFVFIDILGFMEASEEKGKISSIIDVLSSIKQTIFDHNNSEERASFQGINDIKINSFSDSIIIYSLPEQLPWIIKYSVDFTQQLISKGFLCRGAMTYNELYQQNEIVFGKAFNKAYIDETKNAIYPRIILDKTIINLIETQIKEDLDADVFNNYIHIDKDGSSYLNLLCDDKNNQIKNILIKFVNKELRSLEEKEKLRISIEQKLLWLQNTYCLDEL
ncbi:MAG: hypothetical protein ACI8WT_004879 [Clostridium sp.]|jgi:hypothetical protein